jgi:hypothetical protein
LQQAEEDRRLREEKFDSLQQEAEEKGKKLKKVIIWGTLYYNKLFFVALEQVSVGTARNGTIESRTTARKRGSIQHNKRINFTAQVEDNDHREFRSTRRAKVCRIESGLERRDRIMDTFPQEKCHVRI